MGRWTQYDEDEHRLPAGMERIGYDADTGRYTFRGGDGSVWQGAQGAQFSEMTRVSGGASSSHYAEDVEDVEAAPQRADGYQALATDPVKQSPHKYHLNAGAYRTLFPFFLLIGVFLPPLDTTSYLVEPGDTCWAISQGAGCSVEDLQKLNAKLNCDSLVPGSTLCLPSTTPT
ncbi:hypothetical protein C8J57DRAFT_1266307 [Mycena rebaudengoi]|nr:hypothetical protein C8J57DRAFT_1266307 [Mycena rebaudengoi]